MKALLKHLTATLSNYFSKSLVLKDAVSVGGGCINESFLLEFDQGEPVFLKVNSLEQAHLFEAEEDGLLALSKAETIRVPKPFFRGAYQNWAFLTMEALPLCPPENKHLAQKLFGTQLATLHRQTSNKFGWHRENVIGQTRQPNLWANNWIKFWREHRLGFQLELAKVKGLKIREESTLLDNLEAFFPNYQPVPSLLHGDLWSGNVAFFRDGTPVIFDPAVYYGDRETDLAFTEMFGGFGQSFYEAYNESFPLNTGYKDRKEFYNLYHLLNHYNLFGGHYGRSAEQSIQRLLRLLP